MGEPLAVRNQQVKDIRRLARDAHARKQRRAFVVEGAVLVLDALQSPLRIESVFHTSAVSREVLDECAAVRVPTVLVSDAALASMATTVTPQPVMALAAQPSISLEQAMAKVGDEGHIIVLDGVQDPGNAGTILRSAEASGASLVVFAAGSVDAYNPKVVRSSAGSLFRQVVVTAGSSAADVARQLAAEGRPVYGAMRGGLCYDTVDLANAAVVVGNEANGLSDEVVATIDGPIGVPLADGAESLNVAMATTVLCFEAARQRRSSLGADNATDNLA